MTFRELVYMVTDQSKAINDDTVFTEEHIVFLLSKYRASILNSQYGSLKKKVADANYQTILVELSDKMCINLDFCGKQPMLRSTAKIPFLMTIGVKSVYPVVGFTYGNITYVDNVRFKHAGSSKFNKNQIYATIGPDGHLYLKSGNADFMNLRKLQFTGIFEQPDVSATMEMSCDECTVDNCDYMDKQFPLEEAFASVLVQMCVRDITGAMWRMQDNVNDAADETSNLAQIIAKFGNNALKKQINPKTDEDQGE